MTKCSGQPEEPVAEETEDGVTVTYPGRKLPPRFEPLRRRRHCPKCGAGPVKASQRYGTTPTAYLYECDTCVDVETCRPTRWQEIRTRKVDKDGRAPDTRLSRGGT